MRRLRLRQQVVRQHRRDRQRHEQRGQDRDDVGDAQRREQPALDPGQGEQRQEHQDDDHRAEDDGRADLEAGLVDHAQGRLRAAASALFSRSRRKMFSTSTMASSTSSPIATAMPPSVITLIDSSMPVSQPDQPEHQRR